MPAGLSDGLHHINTLLPGGLSDSLDAPTNVHCESSRQPRCSNKRSLRVFQSASMHQHRRSLSLLQGKHARCVTHPLPPGPAPQVISALTQGLSAFLPAVMATAAADVQLLSCIQQAETRSDSGAGPLLPMSDGSSVATAGALTSCPVHVTARARSLCFTALSGEFGATQGRLCTAVRQRGTPSPQTRSCDALGHMHTSVLLVIALHFLPTSSSADALARSPLWALPLI